MARYKRNYAGERRTSKLTVQMTPSERAAFETSAERAGTSISEYAREMCLRRSAAQMVVAGTRRSPEAVALVNELTAIGNNLNQLARIANIHHSTPHLDELRDTTRALKQTFARVLAL